MPKVLLCNLTEEKRRRTVKNLLFRLGIPCREIEPAEQGLPLRAFLTPEAEPAPAEGTARERPFGEEMLIMDHLDPRQFNGLLDGMKRAGVRIPLKAVVTPHNIGWSVSRLYRELQAEHEALTAGGTPSRHGAGSL